MTDEKLAQWKQRIADMGQEEMARLWRFAKSGHPLFDNTLPLFEIFASRFFGLGGMTPEISKKIGLKP